MRTAAVGGVAAFSLVLGACGGGGGDDDGGDGPKTAEAAFDAGSAAVVNPSDKKGGTLKFVMSDDFDSPDPGNTYYAFSMNFLRNYARPLMTYASLPGDEGSKPVPDLAEAKGEPNEDNTEWTYTLKEGLKYEDGSEIKASDVKYAVARTYDRGVLRNGPSYFPQFLEGDDYKGPYKDKNLDNFKGVEADDAARTVTFKLKEPFSEMDQLIMFSGQTAPVPPAKDKGTKYGEHPVSSGPYMFDEDWKPGKGLSLKRNPHWDPKTDPNRKALPDKITFQAGVDANEVDNLVLDGEAHVDMAGSGVQDNGRKTILQDPEKKKNADNPVAGFHWFVPITPTIDNVECRRAIVYAADRDAMWRAYGGDVGGEMSTSLAPPTVTGRKAGEKIYPWDPESPPASDLKQGFKGDVEKAKAALKKCGKPNGFSTKMIYRSDRPKEKKTAEAMQQALKRVGIQLELKGYNSGTYTGEQLGSPSFIKKEKIGLGTYGWAPDWPTEFGYLQPMTASGAILPAGNVNVPETKDKDIDQAWKDYTNTTDLAEQSELGNLVDQKALEEAYWLPNVYAKSLLYRPESLTNVYFHPGFGMYDYANLGVSE